MRRAYLSISALEVSHLTDSDLFGQLTGASPFAEEPLQIGAWQYQLRHFRELADKGYLPIFPRPPTLHIHRVVTSC